MGEVGEVGAVGGGFGGFGGWEGGLVWWWTDLQMIGPNAIQSPVVMQPGFLKTLRHHLKRGAECLLVVTVIFSPLQISAAEEAEGRGGKLGR